MHSQEQGSCHIWQAYLPFAWRVPGPASCRRSSKEVHQLPSLGRNGSPTGTASPPQTPPHTPETLLRASPQHQPCPKSTTTSACTLTVPLLPQTQPPSHPHPAPHLPHLHTTPPTPRSSLSHSKSQAVQEPAFAFGALACLPPPPTPGQGLLLFLLLPTRGELLYSPGLVSGARQSDSVPCSFPGDFPV